MSRPPNAAQRSGGNGGDGLHHLSGAGRSALLVAGVVAGSLGLWVASRLLGGSSGGGGGGSDAGSAAGGASAPSSSSSSSLSSSAAAGSPLEKQLRQLESAVSFLISHPNHDSSSPSYSSATAREESRPKKRLERALATARKVGRKPPPPPPTVAAAPAAGSSPASVAASRDRSASSAASVSPPSIQLRLLAVQLILRYYRRYPTETDRRRADHLKAWAMLHGRAAEAEASDAAAPALAATDPASSYYPEPSKRQQLEYLMLETAMELHDFERMRLALHALLRVPPEAAAGVSSAAASASSSSAASPSALSPGSSGSGGGGGDHPYVLPSSLLLSLDSLSCDAAFHVAPLLGYYLWTFQLGQRLFGERRSREPGATTEDLYEAFHAQALGAPGDLIDFAVVFEIARLRLQAYASNDATILARLGLSQAPPSVLPYDEEGQVIEPSPHPVASVSSTSTTLPSLASLLASHYAASAATAAAPSRAPSLPSTGALLEPLPSSSLCSEEWEIRGYSTSVQSVSTADASMRTTLFEQLLSQNVDLYELPSAATAASFQHWGPPGASRARAPCSRWSGSSERLFLSWAPF